MSKIKDPGDEDVNELMGQVVSKRIKKFTLDMSELPLSIPAGYIAGAQPVETKELKMNDLVLIHENTRVRLRRVLRLHSNGVILGGDSFNDITPHYYGGKVMKVVKVWSTPEYEVNLHRKAGLGLYFNWLRSFLVN